MIEYQLSRRKYSKIPNVCYTPNPFQTSQIINPFLKSMISANHDKDEEF